MIGLKERNGSNRQVSGSRSESKDESESPFEILSWLLLVQILKSNPLGQEQAYRVDGGEIVGQA